MPSWAWIVIALAAAAVAGFVVWRALAQKRSRGLQEQFGPEYDRTVGTADSKGEAEAELRAREDRREKLDIRPLAPEIRERYAERWRTPQARFVDEPRSAVAEADELIQTVMSERGYPVSNFDQRAADISVDHSQVVEHYREGHRLAEQSAGGSGSTEDLRVASATTARSSTSSSSSRATSRPRAGGSTGKRPSPSSDGMRKGR